MLPGSVSPSSESAIAQRELIPGAHRSAPLTALLQNTIPYLFDGDFGGIRVDDSNRRARTYLAEIVATAAGPDRELDAASYFRLSLAARWASVATFAPPDLESQIRFTLWNPNLPGDAIREMAETVLEAYTWDSTAISRRWIASPHTKLILSAHFGEWFAVAVAAYATMRSRDPMLAMRLREAIEFEVTREAKIYLEFRKARDGIGMTLAAALISQNLGDLDRGVETWGLGAGDPLYDFGYGASRAEGMRAARFGGALAEAGRLNKSALASENHRYFALRAPKALRRSVELLLPIAPFFDDWGRRVATHPSLRPEEIAGVVDALYQGWEKLKSPDGLTITHAYPRAVAGILEAFPGGLNALAPLLSAAVERNLRSGLFHSLAAVPESRFTDPWAQRALGLLR